MRTRSNRRIDLTNSAARRLLRRRASRFVLVLTLLIGLGVTPHGQAQVTGEFVWLQQFGTATNDIGWAVHTGSNGDVYVAGDVSGALPGQVFSLGVFDAFIRKYDANGNELWTRQFGTAGSDRAAAVFAFGADVYVGWLTTGAFPGFINEGGADAYLRKYDANGNAQWTRQFGTTGADELAGIFVDATGVYVCGAVEGPLPAQTPLGGSDAFVRKYDSDGNQLWTQQFGTVARDLAFRISGDESGVYVVGGTEQALPGQTHAGGLGPDAFVRKYDADGNVLWTRQFGTPSVDFVIGVDADITGVYIAGRTDGELPGQIQAGSGDAFVRKYDADGDQLWTRQFGTPTFDLARGISVRDSVVYVSGSVAATVPAFPAPLNAVGDVIITAYSAKGKNLWTRQFGSPLADDSWGISAGSSGLYVSGYARGALPGLTSQGGIDVFIGKLIQEIIVEIDIMPGNDQNSVKLGPGIVPVAILTTDTFDATSVDAATVLLEGAPVRLKGNGAPMASAEDVNGDGLEDLLLHVERAELLLTANDSTAELTGRTFDGQVVFGFDSVRVVP